MTILPATLRSYRESKNISQTELAERSKVSKKTISRIELGEISKPNQHTKKSLAGALGVEVEDLAKNADDRVEVEQNLKKAGYRKVSFHMDAETAVSYAMVQHRYHLSPQTLMSAAPLLMAILAECSLNWRAHNVDEIEEAVSALDSIASDAGHLSLLHEGIVDRDLAQRALEDERRSIDIADIFGQTFGEEPYNFGYGDGNPFADYLHFLCKNIDPTAIKIEPSGFAEWKADDRILDYQVAPAEFERLTGGDLWAEFAIMRGYAKISEIPDNLNGYNKSAERIAWILAKIPDDARKEQQEWLDSLPDINLEIEEADDV